MFQALFLLASCRSLVYGFGIVIPLKPGGREQKLAVDFPLCCQRKTMPVHPVDTYSISGSRSLSAPHTHFSHLGLAGCFCHLFHITLCSSQHWRFEMDLLLQGLSLSGPPACPWLQSLLDKKHRHYFGDFPHLPVLMILLMFLFFSAFLSCYISCVTQQGLPFIYVRHD